MISVTEIEEKRRRQKKWSICTQLIFSILFFALLLLATGQITWNQTPTFIGVIIVIILWYTTKIKEMMGETDRPIRSTFNYWFTYGFLILTFIPLMYFINNNINEIITNFNFHDFNWENIMVIIPGPILLVIIKYLPLNKENENNNKLIMSCSKKIALSVLCIIFFFPNIYIVNNAGIDPLTAGIEDWVVIGFFWFASVFLFTGVILFFLAIGDFFSILEEGK